MLRYLCRQGLRISVCIDDLIILAWSIRQSVAHTQLAVDTLHHLLKYEHFKMEGLHTVQSQLRRRDHMWKVDMSDFYMHLLIA